MLKCDFWLRAQHTAVVEITSWVSLKKKLSLCHEMQSITLLPRVKPFYFLFWESRVLHIVNDVTFCILCTTQNALSLRNLLLFGCRDAAALADTQKERQPFTKKYRKNLSCPPLCKCSFLPLITILQFLGKMAVTTWDWCLGSQKWV